MALLKFKRSATPSKVPTTSDLALGELALNTYDGKVYMKKDDGTQAIVEVGGTSGGGTVTSVAATAGTGISVSGSPITTSGTLTITNTAPDQTVTLTQAGTTTITGTYPNFTISSADQYDGTVTSVSGTGTVNGLTLSGTVTSSGSLTLGGTLSGIDLTSQITGTLPVANGGTGATSLTSGYVLKGNGTSPVSASVIYDDGTNVGIGTTSPSAKLDISAGTNLNIGFRQLSLDNYANEGIGFTLSRTTSDADLMAIGVADSNRLGMFSREGMVFATGGGVSYSETSEAMRITSSGRVGIGTTSPSQTLQVQGTGYATSDFRAPIFYDSANTSYYVDAASTSVLNGADFDGIVRIVTGSVGPANTTDGLMFDGNYTNGQYRHRFRKRDDSGGIPLYLDYAAGTANSYTELMKFGPNTADGSYLTVYGIISSNTDIRAPIFYDSDNTGFNLNANGSAWQLQTPSGYLRAGPMNTSYCHFNTDRPRFYFDKEVQFDNGINDYSGNWRFNDSLGQHDVSLRAPIFYDSNNTAYYINPNSTSVLNGLYLLNSTPTLVLKDSDSTGAAQIGYISFHDNGGVERAYVGYGSGGNTDFYIRNTQGINNLFATYTLATGSVRSPIFYDSDNTAYYVDPTSISTLTTVYARKTAANNSPAIEVRGGYYGHPRIQTYGLDADANAWMGLGTDMGGGSYEHSVYFPYGTSGQGKLSIGDYNGTTYNARLWVYQTYTQINGSARSPIFYDSDDTGYYINPNATSNCSTLQAINFQATAGHGYGYRFWASDSYKIYMSSTGNGTWGGRVTGETTSDYNMYFRMTGGTNRGFVFSAGSAGTTKVAGIDASGIGRFTGSLRAPLFYDSNNTAYYADPASESVLNTVTFFGELNLSAAGQTYVDHTGTIIFRNQSGYATSATLTTSGNFTATGNVTAYSDIRVKDNVKQIEGALDKVQAIRGVTYNRTDLEDTERRYGGVIAQEIEKVLPEAIFENDERKAVDYNATIGLLIEAIKELKAEVETLKKG